ncbi:PDZ domain-containing protein [Sphingomicrobium sp. XHP0239]|uniref:M61 family metallopeptidase n=1 Tax=Sphingomicrobium maritimum TaxID=3133972 RepID=UPI0031CC639D
MMKKLLCGSGLFALSIGSAHAQVAYELDLAKAEWQRGEVTAVFPDPDGATLDVKMPAWRTGRYTIIDQANGVRDFAATGADGRALGWEKVDKSTWRIDARGQGPIKVSYRIHADQLGDRLRHFDDSHAYFNAAGIFVYADETRDEPITVALEVPQNWQSWSGLDRTGPHSFSAPDYDVFADDPIETGLSERVTFEADGIDYALVRWGGGNLDLAAAQRDLAAIGRASQEIWDGYPFENYLYIVHATDDVGGATEYARSTIMQRPRNSFAGGGYRSFLTTAAHELIHAWNVKGYRAAGMNPYDYQTENYTDLLWLTEGSTSYFSYLMMAWADLVSVEETLGTLEGQMRSNALTPGREVQSLRQASMDEWIGAPGDMSYNDSISIYREGAIASMLLDLEMIARTNGRVSYRDVHQRLWERFQAGDGAFTSNEVKAILRELTGSDWNDWWAAHIDSPLLPDYAAALAPVGLQLSQTRSAGATTGWQVRQGNAGATVGAVPRGGAAWDAGFRSGDVIVTIDGEEATPEILDGLSERSPGTSVGVGYLRRGERSEKILTLGAPTVLPGIEAVANPTADQARLFEAWMLKPHPNAS